MSATDLNSKAKREKPRSWISNHVRIPKNRIMVAVSKEFIEDAFNLYGLQQKCVGFKTIINIILGKKNLDELNDDDILEEEDIHVKLEEIYALIHQRYVLMDDGMDKMYDRYCQGFYGCCPCYHCNKTKLLPTGLSDEYGGGDVVLFCPSCREVYNVNSIMEVADGACFGTTFCNLFFLTHPELLPPKKRSYEPKIFGYAIHESSPYFTLSRKQQKKPM